MLIQNYLVSVYGAFLINICSYLNCFSGNIHLQSYSQLQISYYKNRFHFDSSAVNKNPPNKSVLIPIHLNRFSNPNLLLHQYRICLFLYGQMYFYYLKKFQHFHLLFCYIWKLQYRHLRKHFYDFGKNP